MSADYERLAYSLQLTTLLHRHGYPIQDPAAIRALFTTAFGSMEAMIAALAARDAGLAERARKMFADFIVAEAENSQEKMAAVLHLAGDLFRRGR